MIILKILLATAALSLMLYLLTALFLIIIIALIVELYREKCQTKSVIDPETNTKIVVDNA